MKQRYDSYKPSGIDWIGDIPSHWKVCRFKNFMYLKTTPSVSDIKVGLENLESGSGKFIESDTEFEGNGVEFCTNNILYGKLRPYLKKVWLAEFDGNAVGDFFVFSNCPNSNPSYLKYVLLSDGFTKQADGSTFGAKMPRVSSEFILTLPFYLPPLSEQEAIAAWLDEKCGEIDAAIAKVDREIELIDELKQSEISRVVTRGLNPDVPLRPSGIDWIGDIPSHWKVARIRNIIEQTKNGIRIGPFGSALTGNVLTGLPYKVYGQWNIVGKNFNAGVGTISTSTFKDLQAYEVKANDILISMMGTIGKCSVVPSQICPGIMDSHVVKIRLDYNLYNYRYFEYIYDRDNSNIIISELSLKKKGSIMDGLNSSIIKDLHILVPPLSEQQAIADYLDKKCAEIDGLKAKLSKKRERLTELRQSIISEVVTGKRRVAACRDRSIDNTYHNGRNRSRPNHDPKINN